MDNAYPVKLLNWELWVPNIKEYHLLKREIYSEHRYYFETTNPRPYIVDIGAYIGLSTLYFKRLFPSSLIMSFEPNPSAYELFTHNLEHNQVRDVLPVNQAVWSTTDPLTLYADSSVDKWWSTGGIHQAAWDGTQGENEPYTAATTTLLEIVEAFDRPVDMVKIDAEGAEWEILFKRYQAFEYIKALVVEYHPRKGKELAEFVRSFPKDFDVTLDKKGQRAKNNLYQGGLVTVWAVRK